jgi:uncharacterized protein (TIGR02118 family)
VRVIKLLVLLKRRQGVPDHVFREFRESGLPDAFAGWSACKRYVHYDLHPAAPQLSTPPPLDLSVDAIEEVWLDADSGEGDMPAIAQVNARLDHIGLAHFVGKMKCCVFDEREIKRAGLPEGDPGHGLLKRLVPLMRRAGWSREDFHHHWRTVHAPLLKAVKPGPLRYCQLAVLSEIRPPDGINTLAVDIDGFSESWFEDERAMNQGRDTPEGIALARDNAVYVERSMRLFFDEREIHLSNA